MFISQFARPHGSRRPALSNPNSTSALTSPPGDMENVPGCDQRANQVGLEVLLSAFKKGIRSETKAGVRV